MTMTSAPPNASTTGGKALNASASSPLHTPQNQVLSPSFDSSRRSESSRRSAGSNSGLASPRNDQGRKKQHKHTRKPRLMDEYAMAESTAMRNANSRRGQTSITHLMNFTLPPRPQDYRTPSWRATPTRSNIYGIGSGHHSIDKARYIHANYRFIVKPNGDYKQQAINADQYLNWEDVLQILVSAQSQDASCPICLSHPVAPRMAKCGHIFCLPCLIRYMHSADEQTPIPEKKARWKKCPICWDSVYMSDTKPVRWFLGQEGPVPHEGDDVVLRLVMRQPGSTLALPRDGADALGKLEDIPWYFAAEVTDYARVMKGSEQYMEEQYDREIQELQKQEAEDELMFGGETEWSKKAVKAISEAKSKLDGIGNPPPTPSQPPAKNLGREPIQFNMLDEDAPEKYFIEHASRREHGLHSTAPDPATTQPSVKHAADTPILNTMPEALHQPRDHPHHVAHRPGLPYYFYQALLHCYLAPLDIRILKAAFGNFASFPSTLLPRVERVSTGHIVDDELRKRTKYLAHLPYGCEVAFLECNWTDVVSPEILAQFKEEIDKRGIRNREKEYREEKERVRAEKAEDDARWATARRRRASITDSPAPTDHFHSSPIPAFDSSNATPPWPSRQGSSFATLASPSTSPSAPRTVWGTALVPPVSPDLPAQQPEPEGDDGWLSSWEQELSAENELIAHVQATSLGAGAENGEASGSASPLPQASGKKKKKKITLMSTTARRAA